jgi:Ca-activated chloride channel family protein
MTFIWPWMLLTLLFLPVLIWLYFRLRRRRQQNMAALGPLGVVRSGTGRAPGKRLMIPPIFFLLGLAFLFFGLARPEMVIQLPRIEGTVILVFDVSRSMTADDLQPTRLEAAKAAAQTFIENQPPTIQIGVVAFSDGGLVIQPPTDDRVALLSTIERLSPQDGTSLGQGIFSAMNAIAGEPLAIDEESLAQGTFPEDIGNFPSAVIVLLSDGENTEPPEPLEIAQLAAQAGVRIYPVGIGSPQGTILEVDGFSILTQLNEQTLQDIASLTNGAYYQAEDEQQLQEIYRSVDLRLTVKGEKMEVTAVAAGISLLMLLIGGALSLVWFARLP